MPWSPVIVRTRRAATSPPPSLRGVLTLHSDSSASHSVSSTCYDSARLPHVFHLRETTVWPTWHGSTEPVSTGPPSMRGIIQELIEAVEINDEDPQNLPLMRSPFPLRIYSIS